MAEKLIYVPNSEAAPCTKSLAREAYKIAETAQLLGISSKSVRRLLDRGLLHAIAVLRHKLVPRSEIERFLRQ